jgi:hypothetical protein
MKEIFGEVIMEKIKKFVTTWYPILLTALTVTLIHLAGIMLFIYSLTNCVLYFYGARITLFDNICLFLFSLIIQWRAVNFEDYRAKNYIWKQIKRAAKESEKQVEECL